MMNDENLSCEWKQEVRMEEEDVVGGVVVVVMWKRGVFMKWMMEGRGVDVDE